MLSATLWTNLKWSPSCKDICREAVILFHSYQAVPYQPQLLSIFFRGDRQKIMTICTIDVHSRDVVSKLILSKVKYFFGTFKKVWVSWLWFLKILLLLRKREL